MNESELTLVVLERLSEVRRRFHETALSVCRRVNGALNTQAGDGRLNTDQPVIRLLNVDDEVDPRDDP